MTSPNSCRIDGHETEFIGSLGDISVSDFTPEPQEAPKYPLDLEYCSECSLLQLGAETPRDVLYKDYWYRSGLNKVIVEDLKYLGGIIRGNVHVDIGANDGTLLEYSGAKRKIAVDPSNIDCDFQKVNTYWENARLDTQADTITAIACLYDLPDPNAFMENVKRHLTDDGIFIAQLMTLRPMLENNDLGNICHEHIEYYSYPSLVKLFEQNGLEIFDVKTNSINGGSYRLSARHFREGSLGFYEPPYNADDMKAFFERVEDNKSKFLEWLGDQAIVGYGASTKMGTVVSYYGWSPDKVVDVNPDKLGRYTIAGAEVVDEIPEGTEYLWAFPYAFVDYFKDKEKDYKGKWLTTIPNFQIH